MWRNLEASNKTRAGDEVSISSRHSNATWQPKCSVTPGRKHWFLSPRYSGWLRRPAFLMGLGVVMHPCSGPTFRQLCEWDWLAVGWGISTLLHGDSHSLARSSVLIHMELTRAQEKPSHPCPRGFGLWLPQCYSATLYGSKQVTRPT